MDERHSACAMEKQKIGVDMQSWELWEGLVHFPFQGFLVKGKQGD